MLKQNKGITIIALVITIIVLMILVSISSYSGYNSAKSSRYYEAISEIKIMQGKVNELYEESKDAGDSDIEYGIPIGTSGRSTEASEAFSAVESDNITEENIGEYSDYRYFSVSYIKDQLNMEGIQYDFIINLKTRTVILVDGVELDGKVYYALCQIEGEQYNTN